MFIDVDNYSDDELFDRVRVSEEVMSFIRSPVGKRIIEKAKSKHREAVVALTALAINGLDIHNEEDRKSIEKIVKDIAAPSVVLQSFGELMVEGKRSEDLLVLRDEEENI